MLQNRWQHQLNTNLTNHFQTLEIDLKEVGVSYEALKNEVMLKIIFDFCK